MVHVQTSGGFTSLSVGSANLQVRHEPKRKVSRLDPSPHLIRHHSPRVARLSGTPAINTRIFSGATQGSDMKTLRSSLFLYLQLDSTIPVILGSDYAVRSSPHFEHCNAPISMRAFINGGRFLCIAILQLSDVSERL